MLQKFLFYVLMGVLVMAAGFTSAVYLKLYLDSYFNRAQIEVPDLTGQSLISATRFISTFSGRLQIKVYREVASRKVPKGDILAQTPTGGSRASHGKIILVTVSTGVRSQKVPALEGMRLRQARLTLSQVGLRLGHESRIHQPLVEEGSVVSHFPGAGDVAGKGESVDVLVAGPSQGKRSLVPRLTSYPLDLAREILREAGIDSVGLIEKFSPGKEAHLVLSQVPAPGIFVEPDQKVKLTVVKEMGLTTSQLKAKWLRFQMPPGLIDKLLTVLATDKHGTRRVYARIHAPEQMVDLQVEGSGDIRVEFYLDDDPKPVHTESFK